MKRLFIAILFITAVFPVFSQTKISINFKFSYQEIKTITKNDGSKEVHKTDYGQNTSALYLRDILSLELKKNGYEVFYEESDKAEYTILLSCVYQSGEMSHINAEILKDKIVMTSDHYQNPSSVDDFRAQDVLKLVDDLINRQRIFKYSFKK